MNVLEWGALIVGGGIGAGVRYLLDGAIIRGRKDAFPLGILVVNIVGSFLLGLLTGVPQVSPAWLAIVGTGDSCQPIPVTSRSAPDCSIARANHAISPPSRPSSSRSMAPIKLSSPPENKLTESKGGAIRLGGSA